MFAFATTDSLTPVSSELDTRSAANPADAASHDRAAGTFRMALALVIALIWAVGASADNYVDNNPMVHLYPGADKAGPPSIAKPGLRLTYYGGSASIAGSYQQLVQDDKGNWVNKQTGQNFRAEDMPNTAGEGYSVVRVGYVDRNIVALSSSTYLLDRSSNKVSYTGGSGMVVHAGCAADYWVNPAVLAKIEPMNQDGVVIMRMVYPLNGKQFKAIRFQTNGRNGYSMYMYDLDTGLMIAHGSRTVGNTVVTPGANGTAQSGSGYTTIVTGHLVDVAQVEVPWANAPTPAWVGQFKQLHYQGGYSSFLAGVGNFDRGMQYTFNVKARGNGWVRVTGDSVITAQGYPPIKGHQENAFGHASIGGLWIPPQSLAQMRSGQVIETNKVTHTKMVVTSVGQGYVTISEFGDQHRSDASFAMNTGILASIQIREQLGQAVNTTQLRLVGQR